MAIACVLVGAGLAAACGAPPATERGLLDDDLLKDLLPPTPSGKEKTPAKTGERPSATPVKPRTNPSDQPLLPDASRSPGEPQGTPRDAGKSSSSPRRDLDAAEEGEDVRTGRDAALRSLQQRMQGVERALQQGDSATATQATQAAIIAELDALLERLGRDKSSSSAAAASAAASAQTPQQKPESPASEEPTEKPGGEQAGAKNETAKQGPQQMQSEVWGELPPMVREQLRSLAPEKFLPGYEAMIEAFYRRLAEPAKP